MSANQLRVNCVRNNQLRVNCGRIVYKSATCELCVRNILLTSYLAARLNSDIVLDFDRRRNDQIYKLINSLIFFKS